MPHYLASVPVKGRLRRIWFDAEDEEDARVVAQHCHAGLEGPGERPKAEQVAYGLKEARELLGGVSRATIYNWVAIGRLERVPQTRRLLLTRESLERAARG